MFVRMNSDDIFQKRKETNIIFLFCFLPFMWNFTPLTSNWQGVICKMLTTSTWFVLCDIWKQLVLVKQSYAEAELFSKRKHWERTIWYIRLLLKSMIDICNDEWKLNRIWFPSIGLWFLWKLITIFIIYLHRKYVNFFDNLPTCFSWLGESIRWKLLH